MRVKSDSYYVVHSLIVNYSIYIGPGDQGILYEYHSKEFGDNAADIVKILEAAKEINNAE